MRINAVIMIMLATNLLVLSTAVYTIFLYAQH